MTEWTDKDKYLILVRGPADRVSLPQFPLPLDCLLTLVCGIERAGAGNNREGVTVLLHLKLHRLCRVILLIA